MGSSPIAASLARPRRGLFLLDGFGCRPPRPDRVGTVFPHQTRRCRFRRVDVNYVRERGLKVSCLCPQGVNTAMLNADSPISTGGDVVKAVGEVLEPADVAEVVYQAIVDERFLILPHPEVSDS